MKETQDLQDIIKCQAQEIRALKKEQRAYRTFYLTVMNRYSGMTRAQDFFFDFLEEALPEYEAIVDGKHGAPQTNGHPVEPGPHCRPPCPPR